MNQPQPPLSNMQQLVAHWRGIMAVPNPKKRSREDSDYTRPKTRVFESSKQVVPAQSETQTTLSSSHMT